MRFRLKTLMIATAFFCVLSFVAARYLRPTAIGEFLVPTDSLPKEIVELTSKLEFLRPSMSGSEFRSALTDMGLNPSPDFYKDTRHQWDLGGLVPSTTPSNVGYVLYLECWSFGDPIVPIREARICERKTGAVVWEIAYHTNAK